MICECLSRFLNSHPFFSISHFLIHIAYFSKIIYKNDKNDYFNKYFWYILRNWSGYKSSPLHRKIVASHLYPSAKSWVPCFDTGSPSNKGPRSSLPHFFLMAVLVFQRVLTRQKTAVNLLKNLRSLTIMSSDKIYELRTYDLKPDKFGKQCKRRRVWMYLFIRKNGTRNGGSFLCCLLLSFDMIDLKRFYFLCNVY